MANCRNAVKCRTCLREGHTADSCKDKPRGSTEKPLVVAKPSVVAKPPVAACGRLKLKAGKLEVTPDPHAPSTTRSLNPIKDTATPTYSTDEEEYTSKEASYSSDSPTPLPSDDCDDEEEKHDEHNVSSMSALTP